MITSLQTEKPSLDELVLIEFRKGIVKVKWTVHII